MCATWHSYESNQVTHHSYAWCVMCATFHSCHTSSIQGGEDSQDALSCRSFSAKEPLIIGLFFEKWPMKIRHPMILRHPEWMMCHFTSTRCDSYEWYIDVIDVIREIYRISYESHQSHQYIWEIYREICRMIYLDVIHMRDISHTCDSYERCIDVIHINVVSHTYELVNDTSHIHMNDVWRDSFICATWHSYESHQVTPHSYGWCGMTHSYVWYDSFICVTWLSHMCDVTHSYVWRDSFIYVTWLIHVCGMTHSYLWFDSFISVPSVCVTKLVHMCKLTHSYVWHDSLKYVTRLIYMCDMTPSYLWHDSCIFVTSLYVTKLVHLCDLTQKKRVSPTAKIEIWCCAADVFTHTKSA